MFIPNSLSLENIPKFKQGGKEIQLSEADLIRFWSKVEKGSNCWNWTGSKFINGYGKFSVGGKKNGFTSRAHRISYALFNKEIPENLPFICHSCDNPACVNPEHLWAGTPRDNVIDMESKGRGIRIMGEKNLASKATAQIVSEIRKAFKESGFNRDQIAKKYNLGRTTVWHIITGNTWKGIE